MHKTKWKKCGVVEYPKTPEDMKLYLDASVEEGDSALLTAALSAIARDIGMIKPDVWICDLRSDRGLYL